MFKQNAFFNVFISLKFAIVSFYLVSVKVL